ncbi:hypothetical protein ACMX2H_15640 [Arthrobacter sulfonylureivorans]|uniref:hypothetical protein n=1 Tax=Arthrobacter sulfonylureivorans TaxID=2486855 RepID=UPI0039E5E520
MATTLATKSLTAQTASEAHDLLNAAVEELQKIAAIDADCGILVTRTGPGQFTVELSDDVPYGITQESHLS